MEKGTPLPPLGKLLRVPKLFLLFLSPLANHMEAEPQ